MAIGNQALLRRLQAKLAVGPVDDPLERQADAVADQVLRTGPAALPGPTCTRCAAADASRVQAQPNAAGPIAAEAPASVGPIAEEAPASVGTVLNASGRPLDGVTRDFFEPRFGRDFSGVRIHDDGAAAASAREVGARAYAVGQDIVFDTGNFAPGTTDGRRLLAHELAHTVQQGSGVALRRQPAPAPASPSPATARTADCDPAQTALIGRAAAVSKANIAAVLPLLAADPLSADMQNALWIYFRDTSRATAATVAANLARISAKLSEVPFECENDCPDRVLGYSRLAVMATGLGHIHLCMNNMTSSAEDISDTMIHELAHVFLLADDGADYYGADCRVGHHGPGGQKLEDHPGRQL